MHRSFDAQCNACGLQAKASIRTMSLSGVADSLVWVCPPRNWFVTQCLVAGAEHESGTIPGNTLVAFMVCEVCAKLGRSEMSVEN